MPDFDSETSGADAVVQLQGSVNDMYVFRFSSCNTSRLRPPLVSSTSTTLSVGGRRGSNTSRRRYNSSYNDTTSYARRYADLSVLRCVYSL